jgi:hypothetical protein
VYQTVPSSAGATSCGRDPVGTSYRCIVDGSASAGRELDVVDLAD